MSTLIFILFIAGAVWLIVWLLRTAREDSEPQLENAGGWSCEVGRCRRPALTYVTHPSGDVLFVCSAHLNGDQDDAS